MTKFLVLLKKLVRRLKRVSEVLLQQGVVALPLAVVLIIFAYDNSEKWFSVPLWFLVAFLVWIGWKSFDLAIKRASREAAERKRKQAKPVYLLHRDG